jgi:hypothetical protein
LRIITIIKIALEGPGIIEPGIKKDRVAVYNPINIMRNEKKSI